MRSRAWPRVAGSLILLAAAGCPALRDIPRDQFGARDQRKAVHIETRDGLVYEFDFVRLRGDSLVGYRRRDVEGPFDEFATVPLPLDDVTRMSARGVDWRRTSLVGGSAVAAIVAVGLTPAAHNSHSGGSSGG